MALPPEAFYLFARGAYAEGRLAVVHDADWTHRSTVKVDIQVVTPQSSLLNEISICRMERKKGERGVALLVGAVCTSNELILTKWYRQGPDAPSSPHSVPTLTWGLKVHLPPSFDYGPLLVPAFETLLPRFTHSFEEMHDDVMFGYLALAVTNAKISTGVREPRYRSAAKLTSIICSRSTLKRRSYSLAMAP